MSERLTHLIQALLVRAPGSGTLRIVHLLYLVDLEARRYLGRPLSGVTYVLSRNGGPYSNEVVDHLEAMELQGLLKTEDCSWGDHAVSSHKLVSPATPEPFPDEELALLDHVAELVRTPPLPNLLDDIIFETRPVLHVLQWELHGAPLPMYIVDNEARIPGLELERVYQAIKDLDAGKGRPFRGTQAAARQ